LKNTLAVPVLVVVIVCAALVVPFACDPKFSEVGENESGGVPLGDVAVGVGVAVAGAVGVAVAFGVGVGVGVDFDDDVGVGVGVLDPPCADAG
jgi:hypothetical protein